MKTDRMELRLDPEQRRQLGALAEMSGKPASFVVRRLIARAYHDAVGDPRPSEGTTAPALVRAAKTAPVTDPDDPRDLMTTDEILEAAGIDMGPSPESKADPVTVTSAETAP